jgi:hypothetical protein
MRMRLRVHGLAHQPIEQQAPISLAAGRKFETVELDADGSARVTFADSDILKLTPPAATNAAGWLRHLAFRLRSARGS